MGDVSLERGDGAASADAVGVRRAETIPARRRALYLALPYLLFALALAATELCVRRTLPHVSSLELFVTAPQQHAQFLDRRQVRICEGDPLLFWRLLPGLHDVVWERTPVTTNDQGLRYPRPIGRKPPGTFRVVCVGDSVTFGFRVPLLFARRGQRDRGGEGLPYAAWMEKLLRGANPDRSIEVVPLAVPGYSSHQGLAWLRRDVGWLEPDVVTACFGWNDLSRRALPDHESMPADALHVTARSVLAHSQALIHARRWLEAKGAREGRAPGWSATMRVPRERYVANLLEIARTARKHGAAAILLGPVYRDRVSHPPEGDEIHAHREALRDAARAAGIPYLEFPELSEDAHPDNARLFLEHIHPNHRGHRLMADRLIEFLAAQGMLGGLAAPVPVDRTARR